MLSHKLFGLHLAPVYEPSNVQAARFATELRVLESIESTARNPMANQDEESLEWEEVEVTDSLSIDDEDGLSLEDEVPAETDSEGEVEGDDPYSGGDTANESLGLENGDGSTARISPKTILEAILFVGTPDNAPLSSDHIAGLMRGVRADEVDDLISELNEEYAEQQSAYEVLSEKGGYRLTLREELQSVRTKFYGRVKEARLSQAAIDVLAIVAYRQPVTRDDVDRLRGRPSGSLLNQLVRRQLVRLEISEGKPRRRTFQTTDRFLKLFGMETLSELPQSQDD